jgi:hypothetical protein
MMHTVLNQSRVAVNGSLAFLLEGTNMKALILFVCVILLVGSTALAGDAVFVDPNATMTIGPRGTFQHFGNTTIGPSGTTQRFGNITITPRGTYQHFDDMTIGPEGTYQHFDNMTIGPSGTQFHYDGMTITEDGTYFSD